MRRRSGILVLGCMLSLGPAACSDDGGGQGTMETEGAMSGTAGDADGSGGGSAGEDGGPGGEDGGSGGAPTIDPDEAVRSLVDARCGWMFDCCAAGEVAYELGPFTKDAADCAQRVMGVLESGNPDTPVMAGPSDLLLGLVNAYARGTLELDAQAVMACAAHLRESGCNPVPDPQGPAHCDPTESARVEDPCDLRVLAIGKQAIGETCEPALGAECVPGARCVDFGTGGVCAGLASEEQACFSDEDCASPLVCDLAGNGRCRTGAGLGEACSFVDPENPVPGTEKDRCARGLSCDPDELICRGGSCGPGAPCLFDQQCPENHACVFGTCLPPQDGGGACEANRHCISNLCSEGANVCADPTGMPNGSPCGNDNQCRSGFCEPDSATCSRPQSSGEPCPAGRDAQCQDGYCDTSDAENPTCRSYSSSGGPCSDPSHCEASLGLSCVDGTCRKLEIGESCNGNVQCASQLCHGGTCAEPTPIGDTCGAGVDLPCGWDAFCDIPMGVEEGKCRARLLTGSACTDDAQCWGSCVEAWGASMCDDTPPGNATSCDGQ